MTITRNGKKITLTANELEDAYHEHRKNEWIKSMGNAIGRAESDGSLRYGVISEEDFFAECVDEMEAMYGPDDWDAQCDEVLFSCANDAGIWVCEPWREDEDDEETAEV